MQSMFEQFSDFLVKNIIDWLSSRVMPGYRYRFHSDDDDNLRSLIRSLDTVKTSTLTYKNVELPYKQIRDCKLIYVNDVIGIMNENFISNLRDSIAKPEPELENCSLLVIHKSRLDTVLNTATDLAALEGPLHSIHVKNDLYHLLQKTSSPKHFQAIMDMQTKMVEEERQSAFGYQTLFHSIITDTIHFKELGLMPDPDLMKETEDKIIEKRLLHNQELHDEIENVMTNFSSEIVERLSKRYSEDFINRSLTLDDWENVSYNRLDQEIKKPRNTVEFDSFEVEKGTFILKDESSSAAGKRTKNILVFCEDTTLKLFLKFKAMGLKSDDFDILDNKQLKDMNCLNYMGISRTLEMSISYDQKPLYFTLKLKGDTAASTFTFKVLVLKKDAFSLENIYSKFIVKPKTKSLLLQTSDFTINFSTNTSEEYQLNETEIIDVRLNPHINFKHLYSTQDEVIFSITNGSDELTFSVEGKKIEDVISIPLLYNQDRLNKLFQNGVNAELNHKAQKAILEYQEIPLIAKRFTYIDLEFQFIDKELMRLGEPSTGIDILSHIDELIYSSYKNLLECFKKKKTTPSLCAWDDEICKVTSYFVDAVKNYLLNIQNATSLTEEHKKILEIGKAYIEQREYMSPFSPLILAYILHLREMANDDSFKYLSEVTLERLNPKGLFPYLYKGSNEYSYTTLVTEDTLWLEFVSDEESEYSYVSKLVTEKIIEFTKAFGKLFEFRNDAPLIINSINNASNKELFKGLVDYYKKSIDNNPKRIVVNLYDQEFQETHFDIFADTDPYETLKERYKLDKNAETIIDVMRTHITYSKHVIKEEKNYAHLTFFKNNEKVQVQPNKVNLIKSGLVCSGLISGESSEEKNGYYYSGFGLRNVDITNKPHLQIAKLYNALQRPAFEPGALYDTEETITLMISDNFRELLQQSYESSLWTVIIDPKVTLDFFNSERDLILIHYSDQYSSSANYDAITVTAQKDLYADVVGNENIIREFNAFNGEWLIKMIAEKDERNKREKKGIIAAYKYMTAFVDNPKITWVPLSIAELLRVAGNVGLSMSRSDFSRYNEMSTNQELQGGYISDDILLVGYCEEGIVLYPVEVKSGSAEISKAIKQAKSLKSFFNDFLFKGNEIKAQLLKGLFIRQLFMQIDKFKLYNVFEKDYFQPLFSNREDLLDGRYDVVDLQGYYDGAVVFFNDSPSQFNTEFDGQNEDNILVCKLPSSYQQQMLEKPYQDLKSMIYDGQFGMNTVYLLKNVNCKNAEPTANVLDSSAASMDIEQEAANVVTTVEELSKGKEVIKQDESSFIQVTGPMQITFGSNVLNNNSIYWYPTDTSKTLNTNTAIIGTMGTGKTQFTKSLITQIIKNSCKNIESHSIDILIFNYKAKDYLDEKFVVTNNAKVYDPYHLPFNPLSLFGSRPLLPVHTANLFKTTLSKAFGLGPVQQASLNNIIMEAYEKKGISKSDQSTWSKPAPTIHDIWEIYSNKEKVTFDSLYAALEKLNSFEIFEPDSTNTTSLFDMLDGITVINIAGYDPDIQNLIVAITLDIFYTQMQTQGASVQKDGHRQMTKILLVDEADNFMSQNFESLRKILKEGREFGVGTILSTQQLSHFKTSDNDYTEYILSWIIHKVDKIKATDLSSIFNISNKTEAESLMDQIRQLQEHFSIYVDGNKNMVKMRDLAFWELSN